MQEHVHREATDALSGVEFFERARSRLTLDVPHGLNDPNFIPKRGDHEPDPVMEKISSIRPIRPAAVLVPIIAREQPMVLLTKRAAHLRDHSGQISFPGGKIDSSDESPAVAALRRWRVGAHAADERSESAVAKLQAMTLTSRRPRLRSLAEILF